MKRIIVFAAAVAALLSCSKENASDRSTGWFEAGETVTLRISSPQTKASSALSGTDVVFKWEATDAIRVTVPGEDPAMFTVSRLINGGASAEFTGTMPGSGDSFSVQYPYEGVAESALAAQSYPDTDGEALPKGKMLFTKSGCTTDESFSLDAQYAVLRLNLWGTSQTISKIVVTNTTSSADPKPTYTLTMDSAVTLPTTEADAQAFFIVVPAGSWNFSADVFDNAATPASICTLSPSAAQAFAANTVMNMPAKEVKKASTVLLPGKFTVSAGKQVQFTKGNLYYSSTDSKYHIEPQQNVTYATLSQSSYDVTHVCHFYWSNITDWETSGKEPWAETYSYSAQSTGDKFFCGIDNPMEVDGQSGLYALTGGSSGEWYYLINSRTNASNLYKYGVSVETSAGTVTNCLVIAPDACLNSYTFDKAKTSYTAAEWATAEAAGLVCLPAAGYRNGSSLSNGGSFGDFWSATPNEDFGSCAYLLSFYSGNVYPGNDYRYSGYAVRLVCAVQ